MELHPDKTRLIEFGPHAARNRARRGEGKPETFSFLEFVHISGRTRTGQYQVVRRTMPKRMRAKLREVRTELMRRRHRPLPEQGRWLGEVVRGYAAYHAIPGNIRAIGRFRSELQKYWLHALRRRSQRHRITWERVKKLSERWLPQPKILHPWPEKRFDARTQGKSPVR